MLKSLFPTSCCILLLTFAVCIGLCNKLAYSVGFEYLTCQEHGISRQSQSSYRAQLSLKEKVRQMNSLLLSYLSAVTRLSSLLLCGRHCEDATGIPDKVNELFALLKLLI